MNIQEEDVCGMYDLSNIGSIAGSFLDKLEGKDDEDRTISSKKVLSRQEKLQYEKRSKRVLCFVSVIAAFIFIIVLFNLITSFIHKLTENDEIMELFVKYFNFNNRTLNITDVLIS